MFLNIKVTGSSHALSILIRLPSENTKVRGPIVGISQLHRQFSVGSNWELSHPIINCDEAH